MRVIDEEAWSVQYEELGADETSRKFRTFLVFWVEAADTLLGEDDGSLHPHDALSSAFEVTEKEYGFLSMEWLGQMLLLVIQYWEDGMRLFDSLSVFERRLVEQATAMKVVELQGLAAEAGGTGDDVSPTL